MIALSVHHLSVNYDQTPVLWDVSFEVPQGLLVGIIGPNGAGKTTLIKTALGLVKPISGSVEFFGKGLEQVRKQVAYVPQRTSVDWDFPITAIDLVLMGRYGHLGLLKWPRKSDRAAAEYYLDIVGMRDYANRQISQLSGGQQQRIFLARALIQEADVYFMDEPFSGVDHGTEKVLVKLLKELKEKGKTVFVVHHDLNTVESYFDWVALLNMRLVGAGPLEEMFTPDNLNKTYGKSYTILDEALKLSQTKSSGMRP
jgi:manganese/zinc/iron transport system ATP- binding protein